MTFFYTSVDRKGSFFRVREVRDGVRHKLKVPIEPYLFIKSKNGAEWKSIYGSPLEKVSFNDPYEAKQFIDKYEDVEGFEIHGMSAWLYPFLNDRYTGTIKYDESLIRGINFDIEVDTVGGLPRVEYADKSIVSIAARKTNGDVVAWGLVEFDKGKFAECEVEYRKFSSERALLQDFIMWWRNWDPDYITGWNIEGFDVPYLIKRINIVCGEHWVKYLSPWGEVTSRTIKDRYGESEIFEIAGVATLDYIALYKKFTYQKQESYSLDFIAELEVGKKKTDYKAAGYENLADLYVRNPQLFIEYNITDVLRVRDIDAKMGLLSLVFSLAYTAKVEFQDTLGTVKLWDAIIHNHLAAKKIAIPHNTDSVGGRVEGAFVKEPNPGLYRWVLSFDLNSLYPSLIMQNNISPEKFVKYLPKLVVIGGKVHDAEELIDAIKRERLRRKSI